MKSQADTRRLRPESAATAGVVLAGGRSTRMGTAKADLEWHGSTLLHRVCGLIDRVVDGPVVVVRAPGQELPPLPAGVELSEDALSLAFCVETTRDSFPAQAGWQ